MKCATCNESTRRILLITIAGKTIHGLPRCWMHLPDAIGRLRWAGYRVQVGRFRS